MKKRIYNIRRRSEERENSEKKEKTNGDGGNEKTVNETGEKKSDES
jgi:hypothetical protein